MAAAGGAAPAVLVFSYGSNNACPLAGRVLREGDALLPAPRGATLHGYARVFARMSQLWCGWHACVRRVCPRTHHALIAAVCPFVSRGGGVADLVPAEGHATRGALCRLTPAQLERLDAFERGYARTPVRVTPDTGMPSPVLFFWFWSAGR